MVVSGFREWRRLGLGVLACLAMLATTMAYLARERPEDELAGDSERIEAVGDLLAEERPSESSDDLEQSVLQDSALGEQPPDDGSTKATPTTVKQTTTTARKTTTTAQTTTTAKPTTTTTTTPPTTIAPVALRNGGFDFMEIAPGAYVVVGSGDVPGWTSDSGVFEIWHGDKEQVGSRSGNYLIELNSNGPSTVYQDFATTPGSTLQWSFSHRGRQGTDSMEVLIGPSNGPLASVITVSTGTRWKRYSGTVHVGNGQRSTRIAFKAITAGSVGNLLDEVNVSLAAR